MGEFVFEDILNLFSIYSEFIHWINRPVPTVFSMWSKSPWTKGLATDITDDFLLWIGRHSDGKCREQQWLNTTSNSGVGKGDKKIMLIQLCYLGYLHLSLITVAIMIGIGLDFQPKTIVLNK